jgi:hypothetical protein
VIARRASGGVSVTIESMKTQHLPLRTIVMLVWALFVVTLTTQTDSVPVVHMMVALIGRTELGATIGHASLFGLLTVIGYAALALWLPRRYALLLAMGISLTLGTATEFYQQQVAGRSSSLSDLLANWLGVFVAGFVVMYGMARPYLQRDILRV